MHNNIYVSFISYGALIALVFMTFATILFTSIKDKSKATKTIILIFFFHTFHHLAYVLGFTFYHPLGAYHRWLSVFSVLPAILYMGQFFFHFPYDWQLKKARIIFIIQWIISIIVTSYFIIKSLSAQKIYHFDGHFYDLNLSSESSLIGLLILLYTFVFAVIAIRRAKTLKGRDRMAVLAIMGSFLIVTVVPGVANVLQKRGLLESDVFHILFTLLTVLGWFFTVVLYINLSKDRSTFMVKIIGVTLVTMLIFLLWINYFILQKLDQNYDVLHQKETAKIILNKNYKPKDLRYIIKYSLKDGSLRLQKNDKIILRKKLYIKNEFKNTEALQSIMASQSNKDTYDVFEKSGNHLIALEKYLLSKGFIDVTEKTANKNRIIEVLKDFNKTIKTLRNQIYSTSEIDTKKSILSILKKAPIETRPIAIAISNKLRTSSIKAKGTKNYALSFLAPVIPQGVRLYRGEDSTEKHYIAFKTYDSKKEIFFEAGYSYRQYRSFIDETSMVMVGFLITLVFIVLIGFRFFFLRALVDPLNTLLNGLNEVKSGNLDVNIPIIVEDEIGFLTRNFNLMVSTIRFAKKELEDYTTHLEERVDERTADLQKTKDALWGEMRLARKIQTILLPDAPELNDFDVAVYMDPADEIGGDYYDFINTGDSWWIVIGDVSGHGVPSGLLMMMAQTSIKTIVYNHPDMDPSELLTKLNRILIENITGLGVDKFMTITALKYSNNGEFQYSGLHEDMFLLKKNSTTVDRIKTKGMWLGLTDEIGHYLQTESFMVTQGDILFLYTDGLADLLDQNNMAFSKEGIINILETKKDSSIDEIKSEILTTIKDYEQRDDVTFLLLRKK